ncbi:hypothetical protein TNCV_4822711 [Trichonephila clavipes]|nr:hypothetical protein TNCV_4822711 [Trichonephila clavipes]
MPIPLGYRGHTFRQTGINYTEQIFECRIPSRTWRQSDFVPLPPTHYAGVAGVYVILLLGTKWKGRGNRVVMVVKARIVESQVRVLVIRKPRLVDGLMYVKSVVSQSSPVVVVWK